jgi:hypothetical protein
MPNPEQLHMLETDPEYIVMKRFDYSITTLEQRYPDGCPDHVVGQALGISEDEVQQRFESILTRIRNKIGYVLD